MGVHLTDRVPVVLGQTADAVGDVELVLAHDRRATVAKQLIVVEQGARDGVLDRQQADDRRVATDALKHLLKGVAADELHLLAVEIFVGGDVVKRP